VRNQVRSERETGFIWFEKFNLRKRFDKISYSLFRFRKLVIYGLYIMVKTSLYLSFKVLWHESHFTTQYIKCRFSFRPRNLILVFNFNCFFRNKKCKVWVYSIVIWADESSFMTHEIKMMTHRYVIHTLLFCLCYVILFGVRTGPFFQIP